MKKNIYWLLSFFLIILLLTECDFKKRDEPFQPKKAEKTEANEEKKNVEKDVSKYKGTFIELGSVNCIPCKKMQPVMKQIEEEYPEVRVIFYDVWRPEGRQYAQIYRIRIIPTQVFLDENKKEYFRHEGFFPKEEVEKALAQGGVTTRRE